MLTSRQSSPPDSVSLWEFWAVVAATKLEHSMYWSLSSSTSLDWSGALVLAPPPTYTEQFVSYPSHSSLAPGFTLSE